ARAPGAPPPPAPGPPALSASPPLPPGAAGSRGPAATAAALAEARRPFDLATGPLLRLALVRLAGDEHVLVVNLHHIAADGWSIGVLVGEMTALYGAFRAGGSSPLRPLPFQYADYAAWQRARLLADDGAVLEAGLAHA